MIFVDWSCSSVDCSWSSELYFYSYHLAWEVFRHPENGTCQINSSDSDAATAQSCTAEHSKKSMISNESISELQFNSLVMPLYELMNSVVNSGYCLLKVKIFYLIVLI